MNSELVWQTVFGLAGGLGIFLLGMKHMSEGMQAVAGDSLRRLISSVTNNRFMATTVGVLVTMLIQSSSITTVMVVGFVNSGLMQLSQAVGVIMGANVGTTITGWILVLNVGKYGLPLLGVSAFVYLFARQDRWRYIAMTTLGVGMVFFGLELMKDACAGIRDLPQFANMLAHFRADSYVGVMLCMLTGCALTAAIQSSSAMLGLTMSLIATGAIPYETGAALVLGENIGTTITALLASLTATANARRAAYFHVLFNMLGVLWIFPIFFWYVDFVPWLLQADVHQVVMIDGERTVPEAPFAIAAVHTIFNLTNTILFFPFAPLLTRFLKRAVPDRPHKEKPHLTSLDVRMLETPMIAVEQSRVEILRMADSCKKMMNWLRQALTQDEPDHKLVQKIFHREEVLDTIQDEVVDFMTDLLAASLPHRVIEEGRRQMRMADEYESISDYIASILKFDLKLRQQGHRFDEQQLREILDLHDMVAEYLKLISSAYEQRYPEIITKAHSIGSEITHLVKDLRDKHLDSITEEKGQPRISVAYTATLNSYRRVRDHALNIAETLAGMK
ncbi:MAG: Na/Pi cotransporter family protein [Pirellulales bacterium]